MKGHILFLCWGVVKHSFIQTLMDIKINLVVTRLLYPNNDDEDSGGEKYICLTMCL